MTGPVLVGQFWGLDSDRILKLVLREIILSQEIQMPPGGRRPMGHRLQQFLPFGRIIDLSEFLRQIQVIGVWGATERNPELLIMFRCSQDPNYLSSKNTEWVYFQGYPTLKC